jgi:hypothetical protein
LRDPPGYDDTLVQLQFDIDNAGHSPDINATNLKSGHNDGYKTPQGMVTILLRIGRRFRDSGAQRVGRRPGRVADSFAGR